MYSPDVVSLKQFYASPVGKITGLLIWQRLQKLWPHKEGEATLGLGYTTPYFPTKCEENELVIAGMPPSIGGLYWPSDGLNRVTMLEEARLPFNDASFNRVLLIHKLEYSNNQRDVMDEVWRVLVPGGRVMAVVPNRMSIWARAPRSPFAYGRPFTLQQMKTLLNECGLTFLHADTALYVPPVNAKWVHKAMVSLEGTLRFLLPLMGGVLFVEAEKQIYASLKEKVRTRDAIQVITGAKATQPAFTGQR